MEAAQLRKAETLKEIDSKCLCAHWCGRQKHYSSSVIVSLLSERTSMTVSKLTVTTCPITRTMYCGSSARLGSLVMPLPFVAADLILVDNPVERGAIAQPILKHFRENFTQS